MDKQNSLCSTQAPTKFKFKSMLQSSNIMMLFLIRCFNQLILLKYVQIFECDTQKICVYRTKSNECLG